MTADTITAERVNDIVATLEIALETARRLYVSEESPALTAAILNETLETIQSAFR